MLPLTLQYAIQQAILRQEKEVLEVKTALIAKIGTHARRFIMSDFTAQAYFDQDSERRLLTTAITGYLKLCPKAKHRSPDWAKGQAQRVVALSVRNLPRKSFPTRNADLNTFNYTLKKHILHAMKPTVRTRPFPASKVNPFAARMIR